VPTVLKLAHDAGFKVVEEPDEVYTRFLNAISSGRMIELTAIKNEQHAYVNPNHVLWFHELTDKGGAKMVSI
jgi:hypothetical protein